MHQHERILDSHGLISELKNLGLPASELAVFGSGPMMAHGLKEANDLDVIAKGTAWELARALGEVKRGSSGHEKVVFANGRIEIFNDWHPGDWDIRKLIEEAEIIDGIPYVRLEEVLKWKRKSDRPKDAEHVEMIEKYLNEQAATKV